MSGITKRELVEALENVLDEAQIELEVDMSEKIQTVYADGRTVITWDVDDE